MRETAVARPLPSVARERERRIGLDARLVSGYSGGVESVIVGLAAALSRLDGPERYLFLVYPDETDWLEPYVRGPSELIRARQTPRQVARRVVRRSLAKVAPGLGESLRRRRRVSQPVPSGPPASDGTLELAGAGVVHLLKQSGFLTQLPTIYHPHDLQHLHLPEYFSDAERRVREVTYRALCEQASVVAVTSSWIKRDLQTQYNVPPEKIAVIPWAPVVEHYRRPSAEQIAAVRRRYDLPDSYLFYPAQTWPHKNHDGLLRALAVLAARGERVPLVLSGNLTDTFSALRRLATQLGVWDQTRWLGFVSSEELMSLYASARAVVIPTRFEAASGPMWEAFLSEVPVAASNVTSLPDQSGGAAILFSPDDFNGMADAMLRLWKDPALRAELVARGRQNVARFTWERTARHFRAHYRRLGGWELTADDVALLSAPPLL